MTDLHAQGRGVALHGVSFEIALGERLGVTGLRGSGAFLLGRVIAVRHAIVRNGKRTVVRIHVPATPVTVRVSMSTFEAPPDTRALAAQPAFTFVRDKG